MNVRATLTLLTAALVASGCTSEPDDAAMTRIEKRMTALETNARDALTALALQRHSMTAANAQVDERACHSSRV